jgi:hypothetical protein
MSDFGLTPTEGDNPFVRRGVPVAQTPAPADPTFGGRVQFDPNTGMYMAGGGDRAATTPVEPEDTRSPEQKAYEDYLRELRRQREEAELEQARRTEQRRRDARQTIAKVLGDYGLDTLGDYIYNEIIVKETVNIDDPNAVIYAIRERPEYQKRFAANAARMKKGLAELDPASYISLENQYRMLLQANGLPANFYDQTDDFQALLEGDVSPAELQQRVEQGYRAVRDADPEVVRQMRTLYGVGEGELAAYFLDPTRAAPLLTRQAQAANIAARGREQAGIQLTGTMAEDLAARGISAGEAATGFAEIGALGELRQTFSGEQQLTEEQLVGGQFGIDVQARQELEKRRRGRLAEFTGGGQFARTQGETSGSTRLAIGEAQ